jgi:hypothetical protein
MNTKIVIQCAGGKTDAATFDDVNGNISFKAIPDNQNNIQSPWSNVPNTQMP